MGIVMYKNTGKSEIHAINKYSALLSPIGYRWFPIVESQ